MSKKKRNCTYSIRKATGEELWLNEDGRWDKFENRKSFVTEEEAEEFVVENFGKKFQQFGIFPNS